jgi:gliding motility-associated-like protein
MIKYLFSFFFLIVSFNVCQAQLDTSFWFVAPNVSTSMGDSPIELHLQTYSQPATVYVRQPANLATGVYSILTIPSNTIVSFNMTPSLTAVESGTANAIANKGLYISSNFGVSAYYTIGSATNKEMISLKGSRALGIDFYIPIANTLTTVTTFTDAGVGFDVVATQTGVTTILITPRAACIGRAKNVTFVQNLNQGQTFSMMDNKTVNPSELAGSIVSSDKPIAVTVHGAVQTTACASTYADQITTSDNIGKDYVILRGNGTTDVAYILATVNSTSLTITNSTNTINWLINTGETYSVNITDPITYIKTDKPAYVLHATGYGCKLSGAQVTPAYCAGSYTTAFTRLSTDSLNLNIYTRSGYQNTFTLTSNGINVPVSPASFTTVPGSAGALVAGRLYFPTSSIGMGSHNILRNKDDLFGLGVHNGSTLGGSSYAYATEFVQQSFVIANALPTTTICSNTTFNLNGLIGGGPITGNWTYSGFGNLSAPSTQYTNNIYTPSQLDTTLKPVPQTTPTTVGGLIKFTLTSTGICPNVSQSFTMAVKQAPIVSAGTSSIICSNNPTINLNGNIIGFTNQGIWSAIAPANGTFTPNSTSLSASYLLSNFDVTQPLIKLLLTSTNNGICNAAQDTLKVVVNTAPVVTSSLIKPLIRCANNATVFLNGTVSGTTTSSGKWTTNGDGFFFPNNLSLVNNYVPGTNDKSLGNVYLKLTSTNNQQCKPVADSVQVFLTQPVTINLGPGLNSCRNSPSASLTAVISGTATSTGIWYGGSGNFLPNNTALTPTYVGSASEITNGFTILSFSTTNNGICNGVADQLRIDFQDKPTANYTVNTVCLNQQTLFTDKSLNTSGLGGITSWQWNLGDGTFTTVPNPIHTYTSFGTFTTQLVVKNIFNCFDTIKRPVIVYGLPTASMQISRACSGSAQQISFTDLSFIAAPGVIPVNTGHYWDFGGYGYSNAKDTAIIFPSQGIYNITHIVTSSNGCKSTVAQSVNITPRPNANFIFTNNVLQSLASSIAFIDSSRSATTWDWNFGNGSTSNFQNPSATYTANGTYTVTLTITDQFGCPDDYKDIVRINNIAGELAQLIPNMITPNNDGKNDFWRLDFINVFFPDAEIEIYNRWGDQIFRSVGYDNAWDGSYKGAPLPVGAYFYTIKLVDADEQKIYKGTITLLK